MTSALDQWSHEIAIVQQDLSRIFQTLNREYVQEVAYVQQQWDHLLGINPNVQNQAPALAVPQVGSGSGSGVGRGNSSGSGSGSGATTTAHNDSNQQLNLAKQSTGSGVGSGSSAMTTAHDKALRQAVGKAIPLSGSGSGSGSGPASNVYTWDPRAPSGTGSGSLGISYKASLWWNWLLNGNAQSGSPGFVGTVPGTKPTDQVRFDGAVSDAPIEWNQNFTFSTMQLGLTGAYDGLQTIDSGVTIELTGAATGSTSLETNIPSSKLNLDFSNSGSVFQIDANATITNMTLAGDRTANFVINGGTTTIAQSGGYTDTIGVNFFIKTGATLNDQSFNTLQFGNNNVQIADAGTMVLLYGTGTGATLINSGPYSNDTINVSGGTLRYAGSGGVTDTLNVPVLVQNGGTFRLSVSASAANDGGKLIVKGGNQYTANNSVYMTGASSTVQLAYGDTLECDNNYYQVSGNFETTDATTCTLQDGATSQGTATVAGGKLSINNPNASGYGTLNVNAGTLNFAGTYYATIAGNTGSPGTSDLLNVSGTTNLQGSSLYVIVNGTPVNGNTWTIIQDGQGNNIQNNFNLPITTAPQTNLNPAVNPKDKTQYILSF